MKSALITGGAGFLGSHLTEKLISENWQVIVVDNLSSGRKENIADFEKNNNLQFVHHDVVSPLADVGGVDVIFHLASPASPNKKSEISYINHPLETVDVNVTGTRNMLELAKKFNARFVLASTSEVYGQPLEHPQKEEYFGNVNTVGQRSSYDESKRMAETLTSIYQRKLGLDARIMRIFNTYGPKMNPNDGRMIVNFITQALKGEKITIYGEGKQTRSMCYVSDLIDGIYKLAITDDLSGEVVNLGNPKERTVLEIAQIVIDATNSQSQTTFEPLPTDDPLRRCPDISKAQSLLGWSPKVEFEDGLPQMIEYFKNLNL